MRPAKELADEIGTRLRAALYEQFPGGASASGVCTVAIPIESVDLTAWLSAQRLFPRIYWQARGDTRAYAAVGEAMRIELGDPHDEHAWSRIRAVISETPAVRFFGGTRFDMGRPAASEWRLFGKGAFVLPRFVIEQDAEGTLLRWTVRVARDAGLARSLADLEHHLEALVFGVSGTDGCSAGARGQWRERARQDDWRQAVETVLGRLADGTLRKVVLARRRDVAFAPPPDPFAFVRHFIGMKSPAYFFCIQPCEARAFVGSSPECLFRRDGNRVYSEALAGTRARGATVEEDRVRCDSLLSAAKDRHEHGLVNEHVRRALEPLCESLEPDGPPSVLKLVLVRHLLRQVAGTLRPGVTDAELLSALHPTPAVGGVPTRDALAAIRELEPFDRGWYAGPLGVVGRDGADFTVAIRSGLLHDGTLSLYCGAGIVEGSSPQDEWDETESKFANFLHVIHAE